MIQYFNEIYHERFHALAHKDFRIYWLGQCISLIGTWIQNIALAWLVFSITGSPLLLGLSETVRFLPLTVFSLFAGVIVDKYPKRKILLITQTFSMLIALILSLLVFTHTVRYEYILILAFLLGLANTIDAPARQSFTIEMTGKEDLSNAIALSSVTFNLARITGPAIGALMLGFLGADWCFLFNGLSFIAVIGSLLRIDSKPYVRINANKNNILKEIKDGIKYIVSEQLLMQTIILIIIAGIFVFNYEVLIPVLTKNVLGQNEKIYGFLMSSLGVGSLLGALIITIKSRFSDSNKILFFSLFLNSVLLILVGLSKIYYITMILLVFCGIANIWFITTANVLLQITTKDEYRGRVMSAFSLVNSGTAPLGYMLSGAASGKIGVNNAFFLCGIATIVLTVLFKLAFRIKRNRLK